MDSLQLVENPLDDVFLANEQLVRTPGVQVTEGRLVERGRLHNATRNELIDHHLDETDLRWREAPVGEKTRECLLRGGTIHAHEAPDEVGEGRGLTAGQKPGEQRLPVLLADLGQGRLQSLQISRGQRLVVTQAVDHDVVEVIPQEVLDLLLVLRAGHLRHVDGRVRPARP